MPGNGNEARPIRGDIGTPFGRASVDHSVPGRLTAWTGGAGVPPLDIGGRRVAVRIVLAHVPGTGFSLLAEDAPLAWDHEDPGAPLPRETWKSAAAAVLDAAEAYLAERPGIAHVADLAAIRKRVAEIDEALDLAARWVGDLSRERETLLSQATPLRRGLVSRIP
jgi:hypothetical protein